MVIVKKGKTYIVNIIKYFKRRVKWDNKKDTFLSPVKLSEVSFNGTTRSI